MKGFLETDLFQAYIFTHLLKQLCDLKKREIEASSRHFHVGVLWCRLTEHSTVHRGLESQSPGPQGPTMVRTLYMETVSLREQSRPADYSDIVFAKNGSQILGCTYSPDWNIWNCLNHDYYLLWVSFTTMVFSWVCFSIYIHVYSWMSIYDLKTL